MEVFMRLRQCMFCFLIMIALCSSAFAVEFETSTGQQDIVLMSTDGEVNMGDALAKTVETQCVVVKDKAMQARVENIGRRIEKVCERKDITYHFKVIDLKHEDNIEGRPIINAFSLPGGYVYIFKDLYDKVKNDDELAGVIAHETAHIVARHSVKRLQSMYGATALMILGSQSQTDSRSLGRASAAISTLMSSYSQEDETFADKLAVKYTRIAGYNPAGVAAFLQKLLDFEQKEPLRPYVSERSHPYLSVRISNAKREASGKMDFKDYINIPAETNR